MSYNTLMQPGQTITPGEQPKPEAAQAPTPVKVPETTSARVESVAPQPDFQLHQEKPTLQSGQFSGEAVKWTASEYVDHAKGPAWFAAMGLILFVAVAFVYLAFKDIFASVLLALAGITFGVFAGRRPQVLQYSVGDHGISIGQRTHDFSEFKSFSVTETGPLPSILLMPLKRFLPPITIFYDPKEEDRIVDAIASFLPHEDREPDAVDRLMSKIRF